MKYCFGTVSWSGYLERYIDIFVDNYIRLFKELIRVGINYVDIADPVVVYANDIEGFTTEEQVQRLYNVTGKKLVLVNDKHKYNQENIMYSTRNRLRTKVGSMYPDEKKVFWYFPIDDAIKQEEAVKELVKLGKSNKKSACMFKFYVNQGGNNFFAGTTPINSYKDIHPGDWGGYCAYTILKEEDCPLYPEIAIPNVAFYVALYEAGYKQYASEKVCVEHLRHLDSHHFKTKDKPMSQKVSDYLLKKRAELAKKEGEGSK